MSTASAALTKVNNIDALASVEKGLIAISKSAAASPEMKNTITNVLTVRGIM